MFPLPFSGYVGCLSELLFPFLQVNDEYMRTLEILSKKLVVVEADPMIKHSKALKDVQPELEKLRQKAVSKVVFCLTAAIFLLEEMLVSVFLAIFT